MFLGVVVVYYGFCAVLLVAVYAHEDYACVNYPEGININDVRDCLHWGGDWVAAPLGSTDSLMTLLNLVVVSLTESWNDLITALSQVRGEGLQPETGANSEIYLLIIYGFMTGSFLITNLFTGFLLYQMNKITNEISGKDKLDKFEENWLCIKEEIKNMVLNPKIEFPKNTIRYFCNIMSQSTVYKIVKIGYICSLLIFLSVFTSNTNLQLNKQFFLMYSGYYYSSFLLTVI
jgi:hypothetical protein